MALANSGSGQQQSFTLRIPESQRRGLARLLSLRNDEFEALRDALREAPSNLLPPRLIGRIKGLPSLNRAEMEDLLAVLFSLAATQERNGLDSGTLAEQVVRAAVVEKLPGLKQQDSTGTAERLASLFEVGRLGVAAKAMDLLSDRNQLYAESRILTDLRPIFTGSATTAPRGAAIMHTLRIDTYVPEGRREHFFSLDMEDIRDLRRHIERAIQKEDELRRLLQDKVAIIDSTSEE